MIGIRTSISISSSWERRRETALGEKTSFHPFTDTLQVPNFRWYTYTNADSNADQMIPARLLEHLVHVHHGDQGFAVVAATVVVVVVTVAAAVVAAATASVWAV